MNGNPLQYRGKYVIPVYLQVLKKLHAKMLKLSPNQLETTLTWDNIISLQKAFGIGIPSVLIACGACNVPIWTVSPFKHLMYGNVTPWFIFKNHPARFFLLEIGVKPHCTELQPISRANFRLCHVTTSNLLESTCSNSLIPSFRSAILRPTKTTRLKLN